MSLKAITPAPRCMRQGAIEGLHLQNNEPQILQLGSHLKRLTEVRGSELTDSHFLKNMYIPNIRLAGS